MPALKLPLCALLLVLLPGMAAARGPGSAGWIMTDPPIRYGHIAHGGLNGHGAAVGYHHRTNGVDPPGARVVEITAPADASGVYRARVAIRDPWSGRWVDKKVPSTFFPDTMSDREVVAAILTAFHDGHRRGDGRFIGDSGHGFAIEGWYEHGRIYAAYPLYRP
jgi:hypothetical protein